MRVVLTTEALERVAEIEARVAERNPQAAAKLATKFLARARTLETFPRMGRKVPELDVDEIRELIEGYSRIVYRIRSEALTEVVTVFDGRQEEFPFEDVLDSAR